MRAWRWLRKVFHAYMHPDMSWVESWIKKRDDD